MNTIMNETRIWFCDLRNKTIIIKSESKHINSKTHKHKNAYGTVG